jgi:hypothetical protein
MAGTHVRVSDISEMRCLRTGTEYRILEFDEIPDLGSGANYIARSKMRCRADRYVVGDLAAFDHTTSLDVDTLPEH